MTAQFVVVSSSSGPVARGLTMVIDRRFPLSVTEDDGTIRRRQFLIGAGGQRADNGN
ncbi:General secretion pathway protein J (modular protein) [Aeromonas salmonicida]|nr:General secretion pathway protein J (modular protein) [Aeromonas salmonicida]